MTAFAESTEDIADLPLFPARSVRPFGSALVRLPGVYRPQADSCLLSRAIREQDFPLGARVLDLCSGTGAQALTAARAGAGSVLAVDLSRRALATTWFNSTMRGLPVRVRRGDLLSAAGSGPFDLVVANPPYVPSPAPATRATRGWDAGEDGRAMLDPLCAGAPALLKPGGFLLVVQSAVSGVDKSLSQLRAAGLTAAVVARARVPFGPVMRLRTDYLEQHGMIAPGCRIEEVVVLRADRVRS